MLRNLRELYQYRSLLLALTQRELKARYRGSVLGFLWTFLNPLLLMLVYALLFKVFLRTGVPQFEYFMFIGLLPWLWFTNSVVGGASTISERRDLLTKVRFPAQVLPTAVVLTNLSNYLLSLPLMIGLGMAYDNFPSRHVLLFPAILAVQIVFTLGLSFIVSALNVAFRDLQHIIGNLMLLWFYATPIVYATTSVPERWRPLILYANPMSVLIRSYQAIFYDHHKPEIVPLAGLLLASLVLFWVAARLFESRREEFAELI